MSRLAKLDNKHLDEVTNYIDSRYVPWHNMNFSSEDDLQSKNYKNYDNDHSEKLGRLSSILYKLAFGYLIKFHKELLHEEDLKITNYVTQHYIALYYYRDQQYEEVLKSHACMHECPNSSSGTPLHQEKFLCLRLHLSKNCTLVE